MMLSKVAWLRRIIGGGVALATLVGASVILVPVTAAQAAEPVVAVDVDLVEGGVWVTFSNGCIESRAWRQPFDGDAPSYGVPANRRCAAGETFLDTNYPFYYPRLIRSPLSLADGERVVALVPINGDEGYWLITSVGRVVSGGAAQHLGDLSAFTLNAPVVAAAPTESGNGYYMLTGDGGVFSFGDAVFYGSVQGLVDEHVGFGALASDHITAPVVTLATTPAGYWLVAADGTVFPFGDAAYHGSIQDAINRSNQLAGVARDWVLTPPQAPGAPLARDALSEPVIGVVPSGGGAGYQMVAADGGIFNFGVSQYHGSLAGRAASPAVASDVTDSRSGYVILTEGGAVHQFGVVDGQWDDDGRAPTELTPTALPVRECRPTGEQGFPLPWYAALPTGPYDIGVLTIEFDDYRADRKLSSRDVLTDQLRQAKQYLEAASYGTTSVEFTLADDWVSVGPLRDDFLIGTAVAGLSGLGSDVLLNRILERAADSFDFSNDGMGFDYLVFLFPPSWFGGGLALQGRDASSAGITTDAIAMVNSFSLGGVQATTSSSWWTVAVHEVLHLPGLSDLYAYDSGSQERPDGWRRSTYGLMGFSSFWPARFESGWSHGPIELENGRRYVGDYWNFASQEASEMLAWHRWRLGWLDENDAACLAVGDATVDLAPLASPRDGLAAAMVKLSDKRFLVLERRDRAGYDSDGQGTRRDGSTYIYRRLHSEGVLGYVVDVDVRGGRLPIQMFAAESQLQKGKDWVLGPGEWRSQALADGTTLRIDVSEGPNNALRVKMTTL